MVSVVGSFAIGFLAGVVTVNPIAGVAIGLAVGAAIGAFTASEIIASTYDINFDRVSTCIFVIGGSALAGALGGFAGYWSVSASFAPAEAPYETVPFDYRVSTGSIESTIVL